MLVKNQKSSAMARLLDELPDDILALVSAKICHKDLCNLALTCSRFHSLCNHDKLWLPQCNKLLLQLSRQGGLDVEAWRQGMNSSYKAVFRFISGVQSLLGIWVHQNPEPGNLVYVTWGFLSLVGCRIVPQELGPRGFDSGLLWAPVFEILASPDGSLAFFLHGKDTDDYCYPGLVSPAKDDCNVLLLEAYSSWEPVCSCSMRSPESPDSPLLGALTLENSSDGEEVATRTAPLKSSKRPEAAAAAAAAADRAEQGVPFGRLSFGDRKRLLELLVRQIRIKVPALAHGPLFLQALRPTRRELKTMKDRHALLQWMYAHGDPCGVVDKDSVGYSGTVDSELLMHELNRARLSYDRAILTVSAKASSSSRSNGLANYIRSKVRQMMTGSSSHEPRRQGASQEFPEKKKVQLDDYLKQSRSVGLRLHATSLKLTHYRAWPIMSDNRLALYKMPRQKPQEGREHAGVWGGTLGWPPGRPAADGMPGPPLFFLLLSYEESAEGSSKLLIGTKMLEGTHYVVHPNGSAMFTVKVHEPSVENFPWSSNADGSAVDIVAAYHGEGIASGYGFRYPGAKPGDLFVDASGRLAFVWRDSKAVLTLQRLDLEDLLRKGERVAALPAIANFAYLTRANSNVFTGLPGNSN